MAETLGSLCDKLSIVKLKLWHTNDPQKLESLALQQKQLITEINEFVFLATAGHLPIEKLSFASNKIYKNIDAEAIQVKGPLTIGDIFSQLVEANFLLWREQEKVFQFEHIPMDQKDEVVKQLGVLNLKRTQCIDQIDQVLTGLVQAQTFEKGQSYASHP